MNLKHEIKKINSLLFSPKSFFESVEKEKGYISIIMYIAIICAVGEIITMIFSLPNMIRISPILAVIFNIIFTLIFSVIFSFIFAFVGSFFNAGINHLGVMLLGGKQGFYNTFKPSTYALIVSIFYRVIIAFIIAVVSMIHPIDVTQMISFDNLYALFLQLLPIIIVAVIIGIISMVHSLIVEIIGISKFQKISKLKAFVAVFIVPMIIFLIFIGLIILFIVLVSAVI